MVFFAGALAGCVVGLGAGVMIQQRLSGSNRPPGRSFATAIAMIALLVSAVALARSDHGHDASPESTAAANPGSTASSTTPTVSSTTGATAPTGLVAVPNVEHLARTQAVTILQNAGLKVSIEPLPLSNVPAGFVISQNPLPDATTTAGATVTLVVSAAA